MVFGLARSFGLGGEGVNERQNDIQLRLPLPQLLVLCLQLGGDLLVVNSLRGQGGADHKMYWRMELNLTFKISSKKIQLECLELFGTRRLTKNNHKAFKSSFSMQNIIT